MQTTKSHTHHLDPGDHRQCFWVTMMNRGCSGVRVPWQHEHVCFPQPDRRDQLAHLPPKCASVSLLSAAAGSLAIALVPWPSVLLLPRTWTHSWTPSPGVCSYGPPPKCSPITLGLSSALEKCHRETPKGIPELRRLYFVALDAVDACIQAK